MDTGFTEVVVVEEFSDISRFSRLLFTGRVKSEFTLGESVTVCSGLLDVASLAGCSVSVVSDTSTRDSNVVSSGTSDPKA